MKYAGFWRRALSLSIDTILMLSLFLIFWKYLYGLSVYVAMIGHFVLLIFSFAYTVIFHATWGQTIGKMVSKIRVTNLDGSPIHYRKALLRSSVDILLSVIAIFGFIKAYMSIDPSAWLALSFSQKIALIAKNNLTGKAYDILSNCWYWSELIILLFNNRRRALHDFIAGTIVIHVKNKMDDSR